MKISTCVCAVLLIMSSAFGATIHVPSEQPTIQAGINAASPGDTVLVAEGTYAGDGNRDINFNGKAIVVRSAAGREVTIIDCQGSLGAEHAGFLLLSGEDTMSVIDGFTIQGAYGSAAVACSTASVTIRNCRLWANHQDGLHSRRPNATTPLIMENCLVDSNLITGVFWEGECRITNSQFIKNLSYGLIVAKGAESEISYCLLASNGHTGLMVLSNTFGSWKCVVTNCTSVKNGNSGLLFQTDLPIGGDRLKRAGMPLDSVRFENCLTAYNGTYGLVVYGPDMPTVRCSDAYGNSTLDWYTDPGGPVAGDTLGNISLDPLFCDTTAGNYMIRDNSPAAPDWNNCHVLMGALGVGCYCCVGYRGNVNGIDIVDLSDLAFLISYLNNPPASKPVLPCPEEANLNGIGIVDISDLSTLVGYLTSPGGSLLECPPVL